MAPTVALAGRMAVLFALCVALPRLLALQPGTHALAFIGLLRLRLPRRGLFTTRPAAESGSGGGRSGSGSGAGGSGDSGLLAAVRSLL